MKWRRALGCTLGLPSMPDTEEIDFIMAKYQLTRRQMKKLWSIFILYDDDGSQQLDLQEFKDIFREIHTPFLDSLFKLMDVESDTLDFYTFAEIIAKFSLYDEGEMVQFAFNTFDGDGSGYLEKEEFKEMVIKVAGFRGAAPATLEGVMAMFDEDEDGQMDAEEFAEMNLRFPHLLWPAFRLQFRIQEKTLGQDVWLAHLKFVKGQLKKVKYLCCFTRTVVASMNTGTDKKSTRRKMGKRKVKGEQYAITADEDGLGEAAVEGGKEKDQKKRKSPKNKDKQKGLGDAGKRKSSSKRKSKIAPA